MTAATASKMFVVDSSGWLEYLTEDEKAQGFAPYLEDLQDILVPVIVIYEVYKKLLGSVGRTEAEAFLSQALRRKVVDFDESLARAAAEASLLHKLAMADAIIYATAQACAAELITSDQAFKNLAGVTLI